MAATVTKIKKKLSNALNDQIAGRKIVRIIYDDNNFPMIQLDDGSAIWIQCDDECNGPGVPVHVRCDPENPKGQIEIGMWQIHSD